MLGDYKISSSKNYNIKKCLLLTSGRGIISDKYNKLEQAYKYRKRGGGRIFWKKETCKLYTNDNIPLLTPLDALSFVIFDTETTGFDVTTNDRLIELGAVVVDNLLVSNQTFHSFANPHRPLPQVIEDLTGIVDEDLAAAPEAQGVIRDFAKFLEAERPVFLAAYNLPFDLAVLESELKRSSCTLARPLAIDVRDLARLLDPYLGEMNLDDLSSEFDLVSSGRHRALSDALMTAELTILLLKRLGRRYKTWGEIYIAVKRLGFGASI